MSDKVQHPTFREAFKFWLKLGFISFGGPTGQIAIMHAELVEKRRWISEARFLHALNFCMLLPGPEAQQLATYIGWLLHRTWGGIVAGALFVLPSIFFLWALSVVYVLYGAVPEIAAIFYGLKAAVLAIVISAGIRIGRKALKNGLMWCIAAIAFVAIFVFKVPFPVIIGAAGIIGLVLGKYQKQIFETPIANASGAAVISDDVTHPPVRPTVRRALRVLAFGLVLWWAPVLLIALALGTTHTIFAESIFFSKAALVTFGGAYAVLPYVSQQAVEQYHWLSAGQMMDGLGLAETTPGPLIMVLQFVGFLGAFNHPGNLPPSVAGALGALITTWTTFIPCFIFVFLGAPHIEQLRGKPQIRAALTTVTAAVVGVIMNLAVWFGLHVLFPSNQLDWFAFAIAATTLIGMTKWNWGVVPVVIVAGIVGLLYTGVFGL